MKQKFNSVWLWIKRIWLGIKKGWSVEILPNPVTIFLNNPIIRVLRVIGGISVLIVVFKKHIFILPPFDFIVVLFAFLHFLQMITVFIIKICYGIKKLLCNKKDFEIRNSPLDRFATQIARIIYCAKVGCSITGGTATAVAAGASFDLVLESAGREKVFIPFLGNVYKKSLWRASN